jgi:hypothetical protein
MTRLPKTCCEHNFFEEMKCEHSGLVGALSQIRHALAAGQGAVPEVRETILRFCELIESHFIHEEEGGYMRDVAEQSPELAARATELLREHAALRAALRAIRHLAQNSNPSDAWLPDLGRQFENFARQLMVHEAREDDLMNEGSPAREGRPRIAK